MSTYSVALYGLFGVKNLGNEATLAATLAALRARLPGARVTLISQPPEAAAALGEDFACVAPDLLPIVLDESSFIPWRLRVPFRACLHVLTEPFRARRTRRAARGLGMGLFLIPGTGIADDFGQGPFEAPNELARWTRVARRMGAAVRFASIGAGPVEHPVSRRWLGAALRNADLRTFRDLASLEFARKLKAASDADEVLPDLVFSLPLPEGTDRPVTWPPRTIGVGVMRYSGWNVVGDEATRIYAQYLAKLEQLVARLLELGFAVRLIIGNRGGDLHPVRDLTNAFAKRRDVATERLTAPTIHSYADVLREIAACDLIVATRFHNILKSFLLARPAVSIGYAAKNDTLMNDMGLGQYCHGIESFEPEKVIAQVREIAALPQPPVATMVRKVTEYRRVLADQFDRLFRFEPPR
ncbi:MAG TPA: polysaccharide pyruvyl transferase family protein [Steroidobacteraceae bacterium]|jgi:polysaccharide pyruvyl transferase WcaK-like protein|nr:polysaccharide pyruvyl transferase family protein [Steroidobacteraceae bacterium]